MAVLEMGGVKVRKEGQAVMLVGSRLLGKQMFADQPPGRCCGVGQEEVTHSWEIPDGLIDTLC